jgi:G3E family GTPase
VIRTSHAKVDLDQILNLQCFDIDRALSAMATDAQQDQHEHDHVHTDDCDHEDEVETLSFKIEYPDLSQGGSVDLLQRSIGRLLWEAVCLQSQCRRACHNLPACVTD